MRTNRTSRAALAAMAALLLAACASESTASVPSSGRGGWDSFANEAPPPPPPLTGALSVPTPSVKRYPDREFTEDEKRFFDAAWRTFKEDSPQWLGARAQWTAMDVPARGLLAMNLYRALAAARMQSAPHLVERAKNDLVLLGADAVPALVGGLSVRAVTRENGSVAPVGQAVLHDAAEALSLVGAPAVPGLMDIAGSGEMSLVQEAVFALGNIGDPRAEPLLLRLSRDPEWALRGAAVLALRRYRDASARDRMVEALSDPEEFVNQRSAQALVTEKRTDALPGIVDQLERAVREGGIGRTRVCVWALTKITGRDLGSDPSAWRAYLAESRQ